MPFWKNAHRSQEIIYKDDSSRPKFSDYTHRATEIPSEDARQKLHSGRSKKTRSLLNRLLTINKTDSDRTTTFYSIRNFILIK